MYMLDSNICIEFMRGRLPYAYELLKNSDPSLFKIPAVVKAELMHGAMRSNNQSANLYMTECFLEPFEIVPFDSACANSYAQVRCSLEKLGMKIGSNDMMIAATALAKGAVLVTRDNHFSRIPGMPLEHWEETEI